MADAPFIQFNRPGGVQVPPRPPPPPAAPNQAGPRPQAMQQQPHVVNVQPHPQAAQVHHVHPPAPPRQIVPPQVRAGPLVRTSDIREDLFTEEDAREELAQYYMFTFTRADNDGQQDSWRKSEPWEKVNVEEVPVENQNELKRMLLDERKRDKDKDRTVQRKKSKLTENQRRHVEKQEDQLRANWEQWDPRWEIVLWDITEKTRPRDKRKDKDIPKLSGKEARSKSRKRSRSAESPKFVSAWAGRASSPGDKKRKRSIRVSITAYYKRVLRVGESALQLLRLERMRRGQTQMPIFPQVNQAQMRQAINHQQQQQQQQQHQQQHQQHQHQHPQHQQNAKPAAVVVNNNIKPHVEKKYEKKQEKKYPHHSPHRRASSRSSHSSCSSDYYGSGSETSLTQYSSERGRKRGSRFFDEPAHYGHGPNRRRHSIFDDHRILDDLPRASFASQRLIGPGVSQEEVERIEAMAYERGRLDNAAERHASTDLALRRLDRLPPRIIQNQRPAGVRFVRPADPYELEEEHLRRRELEEDEYHLERGFRDLDIREEELARRESALDAELMEHERRVRGPVYRRVSSPGVRFDHPNPFGARRPTFYS